jgi:hypothetical protein
MTCPDCGSPRELVTHPEWRYPGGGPRKYYRCRDRLFCTATHGAHPDGTPLGVPGDRATKAARIEAHDALDDLACHFGLTRKAVYAWLRDVMKLSEPEAHVGRFDEARCAEVVRLAAEAVSQTEFRKDVRRV